MGRTFAISLAAVSCGLLLLAVARATPAESRAVSLHPGAACAPAASVIAHAFGSPDDLALQGKRLLFGDLHAGAVGVVQGHRARVLVSGLQDPEGIVPRGQRLIVAEQAPNRITEVDLHTGGRRVLLQLVSNGRLGVDNLAGDGHGGVLVPDSANGRLVDLAANGTVRVLNSSMVRPTGAALYRGGIAVADENANAVWWLHRGVLTRLATFATPDDVVTYRGALLAVTLGDAALWEVRPRVRRLMGGFDEPQGLAVLPNGSVALADSRRNELLAIGGLGHCLTSAG